MRALFLDRDGVINRAFMRDGKSYPPSSLEELEILDGVEEALLKSRALGFLNIVVTNQPDIATGKTSAGVVESIHSELLKKLAIDDIFMCTHVDADGCECRKPKPGMLHAAAEKWGIDCTKSYLIGDRWRDIAAAHFSGCKLALFVDYSYSERRPDPPYVTVKSVLEAVSFIESFLEKEKGNE